MHWKRRGREGGGRERGRKEGGREKYIIEFWLHCQQGEKKPKAHTWENPPKKTHTVSPSTHVASMGLAEGLLEPGPVGLHCRV